MVFDSLCLINHSIASSSYFDIQAIKFQLDSVFSNLEMMGILDKYYIASFYQKLFHPWMCDIQHNFWHVVFSKHWATTRWCWWRWLFWIDEIYKHATIKYSCTFLEKQHSNILFLTLSKSSKSYDLSIQKL